MLHGDTLVCHLIAENDIDRVVSHLDDLLQRETWQGSIRSALNVKNS